MKTAPEATGVGMQTCAEDSGTVLTWLLDLVKCDFLKNAATALLEPSCQKAISFSAASFSPLYSSYLQAFADADCPPGLSVSGTFARSLTFQCVLLSVYKHSTGNLWNSNIFKNQALPSF